MISQTVEYALRAVVTLAHWHDRPRTAAELAEETQVSPMYLSKVMLNLVRAGVVQSQRGRGGGFSLASDPSEITIWDVVQAVDPFQRIRTCPLKLSAHGTNLCPLHRRLDDTMASVEDVFRTSRISDMLASRGSQLPLCETHST